ncbi:diguanylate cyclase domain-containing protein [Aquabacterium sp.]|uniref:diguanylate cyclase domain-containing protein n=1 Tax=Aquabacterium sp. TaxID=1872578 RepID=UPI003783CEF7
MPARRRPDDQRYAMWLSRLTLRQMLTLPYVSLVLMLAVTIGALSYFAARSAVDGLSGQLLGETAQRISDALQHQVEGAAAVLDTAFPPGLPAPASVADELPALRLRFWQATSIQRESNRYAYYGNRQGQFFGLYRHGEDKAELRLRFEGSGPRLIRAFNGIDGALGEPQTENRSFEPRSRPWFAVGLAAAQAVWTPVYIDFNNTDLVATLSRPVRNAQGQAVGVVATDLPLRSVNQLLRGLSLSPNALAYVVEANGQLIGLSRGEPLMTGADGQPARLHASRSAEPLVPPTYAAVQAALASGAARSNEAIVVRGPDASRAQVAWARLRDEAGLDWIVIVTVPQADVLQHAVQIFQNTAFAAVAASLAALLIGLAILAALTRELRRLAEAAARVGEGLLDAPLQVQRRDEIGDVARSFARMQQRLLTDRLTGLSNREAALRRIDERIAQHRRRGDRRPFAVMFVDFNRFKQINDNYGHDVGDKVLQELAQRLRTRLRVDDTVARYAGDEFLVLLDAVADRRDAEQVRADLERAMREPLAALADVAPGEASAGASFGIAMFPADGADIDTLIKVADQDMYRRKAGNGSTGAGPHGTNAQ